MDAAVKKAIFLDRDGVINEDTGYVILPKEFSFKDGIFEFCRFAQEKGYLLIVITNQAGIARGYYTEDDFHKLNDWMLKEFEIRGVHISRVYYCPYHPVYGIGEYKRESEDRKPNPGMILKAKAECGIDLKRSVLIGDKDSDIEAGQAAGINTVIALKGNYPITNKPNVVCIRELSHAVRFIAQVDSIEMENQQ